jgi:SpoVK/Ycf46/Vps4 family AAA+-type ATPase
MRARAKLRVAKIGFAAVAPRDVRSAPGLRQVWNISTREYFYFKSFNNGCRSRIMILFSHFVYRLLAEKTDYLSALNRSFRQGSLLQNGVETIHLGTATLCKDKNQDSGFAKAESTRSPHFRQASDVGKGSRRLRLGVSVAPLCEARAPQRQSLGEAGPERSYTSVELRPATQEVAPGQAAPWQGLRSTGASTSIGAFTQTSILRNPHKALRQIRSSETNNELFVVCKKKNIFRFIFFIFKRCKGIEACASFRLESAFMDSFPSAEGSCLQADGGSGASQRQSLREARAMPMQRVAARSYAVETRRSLRLRHAYSTSISPQINIDLISSYFLKGSNLLVWCKLCLELVSRQLSAGRQLGRKVVESPWLLQIFFIPYVIFFGYFCTNVFFQCGGDLFIYNMLGSAGVGFAARSSALSCAQVSPFLTNIFATPSVTLATEFLRGAHYASKIFLVWSFLTIWKGIRPGQSTKNEYIIPIHINFKTKKRLSDLEGISKFLPLLETCIQSLKHQPPRPHIILAEVVSALRWSGGAGRAKLRSSEAKPTPSSSLEERGAGQLWQGRSPRHAYAERSSAAEAQLRSGPAQASSGSGPSQRQSLREARAMPMQSAATLTPTRSSATMANLTPQVYVTRKYPKGYLFIGPPGTGKTLLAQAVAGEAGVPFIALSASEIQKQISLGTKIGAVRLRNLFLQVKHHTPCILFFDEIDSIARRGPSFEHPNTINTDPRKIYTQGTSINSTPSRPTGDITLFTEFLIQMDGVESGLVIIGTTNFLNHLDSAFIRSGRFDRILGLTYPGKNTRVDLLRLYTQNKGSCGSKPSEGNRGAATLSQSAKACESVAARNCDLGDSRHGYAASAATNADVHYAEGQGQSPRASRERSWASTNAHNKSDQSSIDLMYFAEQTHGWTAADLATLVNESFLYLCHQKLVSEQAKHFWQIRSISFRKLLSSFYQRKPKSLLVHTYKSLAEGMKKISTREKYFQGPKKE